MLPQSSVCLCQISEDAMGGWKKKRGVENLTNDTQGRAKRETAKGRNRTRNAHS